MDLRRRSTIDKSSITIITLAVFVANAIYEYAMYVDAILIYRMDKRHSNSIVV